MAITFTSNRNFLTNYTSHGLSNVSACSHCFKIRVESATPIGIPGESQGGFASKWPGPYWHLFNPSYSATLVHTTSFLYDSSGSSVLADYQLTIGVIYLLAFTWDGANNVQTFYNSGSPTRIGSLTGNTAVSSVQINIGMSNAAPISYTVDDFCQWEGYVLTPTDIANWLNGADLATIGTTATWRGRWSLGGTVGNNAAPGDNGLNNYFDSGTNFISVSGSGTAVYSSPLVWSPAVTAIPYVATSGKTVVSFFQSIVNGQNVTPTQVSVVPTIAVNGTNLGPLEQPWVPGGFPFVFYSTPGNYQINPSDLVTMNAPPAWANTPSGSVAALNNVTIDNRSGRSSVGADTMTKTLRMGVNNSQTVSLEYFPFKNLVHATGWPGVIGKIPPVSDRTVTNSNGEIGLWLVMWDNLLPLTPVQCSLSTQTPSRVSVTLRADLSVSPSNGIGYVRVYNVQPVNGSDWQTAPGGFNVSFNLVDPAWDGTAHHDKLWIVPPGEWNLVNGQVVLDRSDSWALSDVYKDRLTQNVGSIRGVDTTACGGACNTYPFPELLVDSTCEFIWGNNQIGQKIGYTSLEPVDITQTPWIYSPFFKLDGQSFTATLAEDITTAPPVNTKEIWTFSDGATAPLIAGLEIQIDSEVMRIVSGSDTSWMVNRGSNGTTPATHSAGTVTVYGRVALSGIVGSNGQSPYSTPCLIRCNQPHGTITMSSLSQQGNPINITLADGYVVNGFRLGFTYVTGPDTFVSISGGYSNPAGAKPNGIYTLNPVQYYGQNNYATGVPIDVFAGMVGKFPHANLHINIPVDAVDDMVYEYARRCLTNFPSGRKIYVEYANEPWNYQGPFWAYGYCNHMAPMAMPDIMNTYPIAYYPYRATRVHQIFRQVFQSVGRDSEIVGIANCQLGSGAGQVTPHLNMALQLGQPLDAIACAPYYSLTPFTNTVSMFNTYDDDQALDMLTHDLWHNPTGVSASIADNLNAVKAYNLANNANVAFMGYEGGVEWASAVGGNRYYERNHDMIYNPNFYHHEQAFYALLQTHEFDHLHIYSLGIGWAPEAWGIYHKRNQRHSLGDGRNGASDNRNISVVPESPNYVTPEGTWNEAQTKQDLLCDSPRGQALVDWLGAIGESVQLPESTREKRFLLRVRR